jgi:hypothetical protein
MLQKSDAVATSESVLPRGSLTGVSTAPSHIKACIPLVKSKASVCTDSLSTCALLCALLCWRTSGARTTKDGLVGGVAAARAERVESDKTINAVERCKIDYFAFRMPMLLVLVLILFQGLTNSTSRYRQRKG